jgi:hypothetical protein
MERAKLTSWTEKFRFRLAREKKKNCMGWGRQLPGILNGPVSGLDVERWFRMLARHIARDKKMYDGVECWSIGVAQRFSASCSNHRALFWWYDAESSWT